MPGTFSPSPCISDPMHHETCVTHVPWCMPGSLTSSFLWNRWRGKRSRHSRRMRNPQITYLVRGPCCACCQRERSDNRATFNVLLYCTYNICATIYPSEHNALIFSMESLYTSNVFQLLIVFIMLLCVFSVSHSFAPTPLSLSHKYIKNNYSLHIWSIMNYNEFNVEYTYYH